MNKLTLILSLYIVVFSNILSAQNFIFKGEEDVQKAIEKCEKENKLFVVYTVNDHEELDDYKSGRVLKNEVLVDPSVANKLKENAISLLVDLSNEAGVALANSNEMHPYLSYSYFYDYTNGLLRLIAVETTKNTNAQSYIELIDNALSIKEWSNQWINDDYSKFSGSDAEKFYHTLSKHMSKGYSVSAQHATSLIINQLQQEYFWDENHATTFQHGVFEDIDHPSFKYLLANKDKFISIFNSSLWETSLTNHVNYFLQKAIDTKNKNLLNKILDEILTKATNPEDVVTYKYIYRNEFEYKVNGKTAGNKVLKELFTDDKVNESFKKAIIDDYIDQKKFTNANGSAFKDESPEKLNIYIDYYKNIKADNTTDIVEKLCTITSLYNSLGDQDEENEVIDKLILIINKSKGDDVKYNLIEKIYNQKSVNNPKLFKSCITVLSSIINKGCEDNDSSSCSYRIEDSKQLIKKLESEL